MVSTPFEIRCLDTGNAPAFMALRRLSVETEPLAFGSSPADDRLCSLDAVVRMLSDCDEQAVFGAFANQQLIGMVGVIRESGLKERHKARLWGMFVTPEWRKQKVGTALLHVAIGRARQWPDVLQLMLCVSDSATAARALYMRAGFDSWGREPRALIVNGQSVDELHLWLDLRSASAEQQSIP